MTPRAARTKLKPSTSKRGSKHTQRERLLAGMVATANRHGYAGANVSSVIAAAGVSRPTFYEYFRDRDDCFLEALKDAQQQLLDRVARAVSSAPPQGALTASVEAVVGFASAAPAQALFLMSEAMAGGHDALEARDRAIAQLTDTIETAHQAAGSHEQVPDVNPRVAIGGTYRLLASRLRRGELDLSRAQEDLTQWIECYQQPGELTRWRTLKPLAPEAGTELLGRPLSAPGAPPPGRPIRSAEEVAANRRQRIMYAAAELAERKGCNATTIADITRLAGVDGQAFYAAFADKQDAFMAAHELGVQQVMHAVATAFFTGVRWPERVWAAGCALTGFLQSNPLVAHVGFVEAHAVGPGAVQRVEDSHLTFTIFLQEGYQQPPRRMPPSRLALEAIITAIFETVYLEARKPGESQLPGMRGHIAFMALAPFLGADAANEFVDERLAELADPTAGTR
jgi:AcrR family transcriptional regulator